MLQFMSRLLFLSAAFTASLTASISITLTPSLPSPQPLGTSVQWTAAITDTEPGGHLYRFNTQPSGLPVQIKRDFAQSNQWTWTPGGYEDTVRIVVIVVNTSTGSSGFAQTNYTITSRLVAGHAAVNPTNHPLVALFSAPACAMPNLMRVRYSQAGQAKSFTTNLLP